MNKWQKCADVTLDAIQQLEKYGFICMGIRRPGHPVLPSQAFPIKHKEEFVMQHLIMKTTRKLLADTRKEGVYGWQQRSMPVQTKSYIKDVQGCICPTLQTVESFYTKNGLPMEYDKTFDYEDRYSIVQLPPDNDGNNYYSQSTGTSMKLHAEREPRFLCMDRLS